MVKTETQGPGQIEGQIQTGYLLGRKKNFRNLEKKIEKEKIKGREQIQVEEEEMIGKTEGESAQPLHHHHHLLLLLHQVTVFFLFGKGKVM